MRAWKAFRQDENGNLLFLFHGLNKTRRVSTNRWITAEQKMVSDGQGGQEYLSGFHVFLDANEIPKWKKRTVLPSVVLPVEVKSVKPKWSNSKIGVAKHLRVTQ